MSILNWFKRHSLANSAHGMKTLGLSGYDSSDSALSGEQLSELESLHQRISAVRLKIQHVTNHWDVGNREKKLYVLKAEHELLTLKYTNLTKQRDHERLM